jgi:hypothetical protein
MCWRSGWTLVVGGHRSVRLRPSSPAHHQYGDHHLHLRPMQHGMGHLHGHDIGMHLRLPGTNAARGSGRPSSEPADVRPHLTRHGFEGSWP